MIHYWKIDFAIFSENKSSLFIFVVASHFIKLILMA